MESKGTSSSQDEVIAFQSSNNNIRKRSRGGDGHDDRDGDDDEYDCNDIKPEAVHSTTTTSSTNPSVDQNKMTVMNSLLEEISDGRFPTFAELATILDYLGTMSSTGQRMDRAEGQRNDNNNLSTVRSSIKRILVSLKGWAVRHDAARSSDEEHRHMMWFKKQFLQLGGLVRLALVVEQNMDDLGIVWVAAELVCVCISCPRALSDDEWTTTRRGACLGFVMNSGIRTFLLAFEEFVPSEQENNWSAATTLWVGIRNVMVYLEDIHIAYEGGQLLPIVYADLRFLEGRTAQFTDQRVHIMAQFACLLSLVLTKHEEMVVHYNQNGSHPMFLQLCQAYQVKLLEDPSIICDILNYGNCCASSGILSNPDMMKWLPIVIEALLLHSTNRKVDTLAYQLIKEIANSIGRQELEQTDLYNGLLAIVQSDTTPRPTKNKYRSLLSKFLA